MKKHAVTNETVKTYLTKRRSIPINVEVIEVEGKHEAEAKGMVEEHLTSLMEIAGSATSTVIKKASAARNNTIKATTIAEITTATAITTVTTTINRTTPNRPITHSQQAL